MLEDFASNNISQCNATDGRTRTYPIQDYSQRTSLKRSLNAVGVSYQRIAWVALFLFCHPNSFISASTTIYQRQEPAELEHPLSITHARRGKSHFDYINRRRRTKEETLTTNKKVVFQNNQKEEKANKEGNEKENKDKDDKAEKENPGDKAEKENPGDKAEKENPGDKEKPNKAVKTDVPTFAPSPWTLAPTRSPQPSNRPSVSPSDRPTKIPTSPPTEEPTKYPSSRPTYTPGSPTPLPTQWETAWHGDFTVKMSIFTFSDGDFVPPQFQKSALEASAKNGNRNLKTKEWKDDKDGLREDMTRSRINMALDNYRKNRFTQASPSTTLTERKNGKQEVSEIGVKHDFNSNATPMGSKGRKLKITAGDILDGKEPELIHDVLTTFAETLCNETDFKILTEQSLNFRKRYLPANKDVDKEKYIPELEDDDEEEENEEENILVDFCAGNNEPVDRFKDYSKRDTVIYARLENFDSDFPAFELEDRDTYVNDVGDSLHWVEWEVRYDVIQVDRFTLSDVREEEMEKRNENDIDVDTVIDLGIDSIKRRVQKKLSLASTSGTMDDVLAEKNDLILASSPIGSEALRFPEALSEWLVENEEDRLDNVDPNSIQGEIEPKATPILSPIQISGIIMLALLVIFTTTLIRHAKKSEENKSSETWNRDIFTYEGVDFMLDAGRRNASLGQQQENEQSLSSPEKVQVLVKPKNVASTSNNEERITFMSMDDIAISPCFPRR